jgi:hypothetical protein
MSPFSSFYDKDFNKSVYAPRAYLITLALKTVGECPAQRYHFLNINCMEQNGYLII